MSITRSQVGELLENLKALPAINKSDQKLSKQMAVNLMALEIRALQKRGYDFEHIAQLLTSRGLSISVATLRNYLQRAQNRKAKRPAKTDVSGLQKEE